MASVFNFVFQLLTTGPRSALSIRKISSNALRKFWLRPPSIQDTAPCQVEFWRKKIRREKVAIFPS